MANRHFLMMRIIAHFVSPCLFYCLRYTVESNSHGSSSWTAIWPSNPSAHPTTYHPYSMDNCSIPIPSTIPTEFCDETPCLSQTHQTSIIVPIVSEECLPELCVCRDRESFLWRE